MLVSLKNFFASNSFIPHGLCYLWKPQLVWLHVVSDSLNALAYYSIPIMLLYFVHKRRDVPFPRMFLMFGTFIIACGTIHLISIWTLWHPDYWLSGGIKLFTAFVSLYTAAELLPLIPQALALATPAQLVAAIRILSQEISDRISAEDALRQSEARFRLIFEDAAIGIGLANVAGQLVATNPAFQQMLGYSQSELQGMHLQEFTFPDLF